MLAVLFSWIVIFFVFFSFGDALNRIFLHISSSEYKVTIVDTFLLGMVFVGSLIAIVSFLVPANFVLMLVLIGLSIAYWCIYRQRLSGIGRIYAVLLQKLPLLVVLISVICVSAYCMVQPFWFDTLFYHHQNVMWNEQYSIVPGLANVQPRFGFNSSLFLLVSTFSMSPIFGQIIYGVQSLCLLVVVAWTIYKCSTCKNLLKNLLVFLALAVFLYLSKNQITSLSTDLVPNLLVLYIVFKFVFEKNVMNNSAVFVFAISTFCITLKVSIFPLAILCLYIMYICLKEKSYKELSFFLALGLMIAVPWFARNVVLSGYLIFPFSGIDIFNVDWKVPLEYVKDQQDFIKYFAQGTINQLTLDEGRDLPLSEWMPIWWNYGKMHPWSAKLFFLIIPFSLLISIGAYVSSIRQRKLSGLLLLHSVLLFVLIVWLLNAPDLRFVSGVMLGFALLSIYVFAKGLKLPSISINKKTSPTLASGFLLLLCIFSFRYVYYNQDYGLSLIKPQGMDVAHKYMEEYYYAKEQALEPHDINGVTIYMSNLGDLDIFTYDAPLPAGRDFVGGISMRGKSLQDGFRCLEGYPHRKTYIDKTNK